MELLRNTQGCLLSAKQHFAGNNRTNYTFNSHKGGSLERKNGSARYHILLADDDEDDRQFFTDAINAISSNYKLSTVRDGEELINQLKENKMELPDFIFLDLNMPYKNGLECLKEIRAMEGMKEVPVLIYSTSINADQVDSSYRCGADRYIQKPTSYDGIVRLLRIIFSMEPAQWEQKPGRNEFLITS
jgi:CheY-like chemotaxis protein